MAAKKLTQTRTTLRAVADADVINHNPSRKGHLPPPKEWSCLEHGSLGCMACWWILEATRLHNEKTMPLALQSELPRDPAVRSFLSRDPGVCFSISEQVSQIFDVPRPQRQPDEIKIFEDEGSPPVPQRRFYRRKIAPDYPYPEYMDWFRRNSGALDNRMLPEDIAFLLTRGEFYYRNYANLKNNPPRRAFQSAAISYDNPSWKRSWDNWRDDRNPLDISGLTAFRTQEGGTSAVGVGDAGIITREKSVRITVEALPDLIHARDLNKEQKLQLVAEREKMKSEKSTSLLTGKARASHLKTCRRRIKQIDKELRALNRNRQKVRVPGNGRPSFLVQIPPCPEGSEPIEYFKWYGPSHRLMKRKNFCAYIKSAFGLLPKDHLDHWDHDMAALENAILRHAATVGLLDDWEKDLTAPKEEMWLRDEDIADLDPGAREPTALDNSTTGYARNEAGQLADQAIQKSALKNHGDWRWGRGHGPDGGKKK